MTTMPTDPLVAALNAAPHADDDVARLARAKADHVGKALDSVIAAARALVAAHFADPVKVDRLLVELHLALDEADHVLADANVIVAAGMNAIAWHDARSGRR